MTSNQIGKPCEHYYVPVDSAGQRACVWCNAREVKPEHRPSNQEAAKELADRMQKPAGTEWVSFDNHFYHGCCECGLSHRVVIARDGDGHQVRWTYDEALTEETRRRHDHPLWQQLQAAEQHVKVLRENIAAHEPPAVLDLPEPHYNRADNIMEMSPEQWANVRIAFGALRQQMQRASQPPAESHSADHLQRFTDWLVKEMPAGTVIGDPAWWARKLLAAACVFADEAPETPRITDQQCDGIIEALETYEWTGFTRDDIRLIAGTIETYRTSETKSAVPCEHDLLKPETTVVAESKWDAYCTVCKEQWHLPRPTSREGESR